MINQYSEIFGRCVLSLLKPIQNSLKTTYMIKHYCIHIFANNINKHPLCECTNKWVSEREINNNEEVQILKVIFLRVKNPMSENTGAI